MKVTWKTSKPLGYRIAEAYYEGKHVARVQEDAHASPNDMGAERYSIEILGRRLRGDQFRFRNVDDARAAVERLLQQKS